jgi:arylsulfatase
VTALLLFPGACGGSAGQGAVSSGGTPRNLLLVLLDTTRSDHLSAYGYGRPTTPTIDALALEGVRFESVFAQSSLTPVSAGTLLSGTLPFRHGVRSLYVVDQEELSSGVPSLFELLGRSGRRTAGFVSAKPMGRHYGLARGFDEYDDDLEHTRERYRITRFADAAQRPADETAELVLGWLDRHGREPFAVLFHMFDAHDPSFVPPRDFLAEQLEVDVPHDLPRYLPDAGRSSIARTPAELVALYDAELRFMDAQLARVLARLEDLGVRDETLVVVVADHGEAFGEHGFYTHGLLYREHLQVPLVLQGPGLPSGLTVTARTRVVDVFPTLVDLMGLEKPETPGDGVSLLPLATGGAGTDRDVYAEVHHAEGDPRGRETEMYTLVVGHWKYVHRPASGQHELFDLENDPGETTNLDDEEVREARLLRERIEQLGAVDGVTPSPDDVGPEEAARIRALGY